MTGPIPIRTGADQYRNDHPPVCMSKTARLAMFIVVWSVIGVGLLVLASLLVPTDDPTIAPADDTSTLVLSALPVAPRPVSDLARLPSATTFGVVVGAPTDLNREQAPGGHVVHPTRTVPVYSAPGSDAFAALPSMQISSQTWVPVIADEPGWLQVLLPARPNGSTGWLSTQDTALEHATSPYLVTVDRATFQLSLYRDGQHLGRWTVGLGKPSAETPRGRTFVLASLVDPHQRFSPVILPLGTHSTSLETYGGGPGTTGIHGWPSTDVFGKPSSDGCIRVPADALRLLSTEVPLGTPVLID